MNLFRVGGIQLSVHASFALLVAYFAWEGWSVGSWQGAAWMVAYILALFICVTLHELGHAIAAKRYGVRVPRILLLPIGGMAEMDSIPRRPRHEIVIALAGPAVNYVIVAALLPFVNLTNLEELTYIELSPNGILSMLLVANLVLGVFNLLPAFPMDGGRVLRALLASRMDYVNATRVAVHAGKVVALVAAYVFAVHLESILAVVLFAFIIFAGQRELDSVVRAERLAAYQRAALARFAPTIVVVPPTDLPPPRFLQ